MLGLVAQQLHDVAHVVQPEMPLDGLFSETYGYRTEAGRDALAFLVCPVKLVRGPMQPQQAPGVGVADRWAVVNAETRTLDGNFVGGHSAAHICPRHIISADPPP